MNSKELMKRLEKMGWKVVRSRGSHHQMRHPDHAHTITVPHPKKELGKGLLHAILKQSGLKE
ncbi:MAG: type II toxin-antitoxin system HicA family toxin [Mariprofundales bacterium]